ncbi:short-chain dehydrogenase [Umbelopsis sp. PMI_123]|nr:short-chain dehydrogenase [Umbelopsis sp. PMI_123]
MVKKFTDQTTAEEVADALSYNIRGKTVLITGATWGGLGAEAARVIAKHDPKLIILACRKEESIQEVIDKIKQESPDTPLRGLVLDLASLKSVRKAAKEVNNFREPIDVLINNAGVMATPYFKTEDGFEGQLGINHLGPFEFTNLIMDRILASKTGTPRIVNVSSSVHWLSPIRYDDPGFSNGKAYNNFHAYGQSKTANILFSKELSRRYKSQGLVAFSLHPGGVHTNLLRHFDIAQVLQEGVTDWKGNSFDLTAVKWKSLEVGAATHIVAAFDPSIVDQNGSYLEDAQVNNQLARPDTLDEENAIKLWNFSEQLLYGKVRTIAKKRSMKWGKSSVNWEKPKINPVVAFFSFKKKV